MSELFDALQARLGAGEPAVVATIIDGAGAVGHKLLIRPGAPLLGGLGEPALDIRATADGLDLLTRERSEQRRYATPAGEVVVFLEVYPRPPRLLIFGAVHTGVAIAAFAKLLGFRVSVIDARSAFATAERFPHVDDLIVQWPDEALQEITVDESTYAVLLTHDEKFDDPTLMTLLRTDCRYIGAIGSRATSAARNDRLRAAGFSDADLTRIHSPIGLDLGSVTPEEIALSIVGEMIAARYGRDGRRLSAKVREAAIDEGIPW
ncbi:MAG: XdhC family protein [Chloroflexi bacterium]|nr:XdhC family protein [Chloroflexota bacterium]